MRFLLTTFDLFLVSSFQWPMHLFHNHYSPFLLWLKLFLALVLGLLLLPFIILALIFLFFPLVLLFIGFCIFFLALMLFKTFFKSPTEIPRRIDHQQEPIQQELCLEMNSSELSFDPCESEDSKNEMSEAQNLSRHYELWQTWNPQSVDFHGRKPFKELLSFWRRQEALARY